MNLHDVPERRSAPEDVITRETILRAADRLREGWRPEYVTQLVPDPRRMRVGALPQPVRVWEDDFGEPRPNFRTYHATETAIRVIGEIYELHARLQSYNMLAGRGNRLAVSVTPQEYQELRLSASPYGDNPIAIDYQTGTMSVMGMTVLPSR